MANEHFFPGDYFSSSRATGAAAYAGTALPGGLDAAAAYGTPPWAVADQMMMVPAAGAESVAHFDSTLSSLVSSPGGALVNGGGDDMAAIGDLIVRLGSICNGASVNNSCYSTPVSSPPPPLAFRGYAASAAAIETGRLSGVSSSKSLGAAAAAALESSEADMSPTMAGAKPDQPAKPSAAPAAAGEASARKRKSSAKAKASSSSSSLPTATAATNANPKRSKVACGGADDDGDGDAAAEEEMPEPPKDYIHVRARRGQATDSHSLAERERRERISERMKLLQSLVPGCNKITGKALMLDEIIYYVQSLQRRVEFLSMKLATMNSHLDFDGHYMPSKDISHMPIPVYTTGDPTTATTFSNTGSPATTDPFDTYNCWELHLHTAMQIKATVTNLSQDGSVTTMASSSSSLPHHPPHNLYWGSSRGRQ